MMRSCNFSSPLQNSDGHSSEASLTVSGDQPLKHTQCLTFSVRAYLKNQTPNGGKSNKCNFFSGYQFILAIKQLSFFQNKHCSFEPTGYAVVCIE